MWSYFSDPWKQFSEYVLSPQANKEAVDQELEKHRSRLPKPVFWLLGKTQSGKTSIIRALTGATQAEIGSGFVACTKASSLYAFPDAEHSLLQFLDTRGIGEAGYDPAQDIEWCQSRSQLLVVVVRATDQATARLIETVRQIHHAKPDWPIIVVQTTLHLGYGGPGVSHVVPYPYDEDPWPETVPKDLVRALRYQREAFAGLATTFVAVDLTLPEDGLEPADYGIEALWSAIETVFPHGIRELISTDPELRERLGDIYYETAWRHVVGYAAAAGAAGAVPIPLVDLPAVMAIQAKMFHSIASIYGQSLSRQLMMEFGGVVGTTLVGRFGRSLFGKLIPGFGSVVGAVYNAATTYALGCALCWYFSRIRAGDVPSGEQLRKFYEDELAEGYKRFKGMFSGTAQPTEAAAK